MDPPQRLLRLKMTAEARLVDGRGSGRADRRDEHVETSERGMLERICPVRDRLSRGAGEHQGELLDIGVQRGLDDAREADSLGDAGDLERRAYVTSEVCGREVSARCLAVDAGRLLDELPSRHGGAREGRSGAPKE